MEDRKLAAIMFTDIVGFSQKMGEDENLALQLLDKHKEILKQSIENFKGNILKHSACKTLYIVSERDCLYDDCQ